MPWLNKEDKVELKGSTGPNQWKISCLSTLFTAMSLWTRQSVKPVAFCWMQMACTVFSLHIRWERMDWVSSPTAATETACWLSRTDCVADDSPATTNLWRQSCYTPTSDGSPAIHPSDGSPATHQPLTAVLLQPTSSAVKRNQRRWPHSSCRLDSV